MKKEENILVSTMLMNYEDNSRDKGISFLPLKEKANQPKCLYTFLYPCHSSYIKITGREASILLPYLHCYHYFPIPKPLSLNHSEPPVLDGKEITITIRNSRFRSFSLHSQFTILRMCVRDGRIKGVGV